MKQGGYFLFRQDTVKDPDIRKGSVGGAGAKGAGSEKAIASIP